ncbi:MAG: TolC family protein [Deltaproteobacteria bacterium]|nr:TolC family protein [Deltaproteobacteria bacterium]
MRAWSLAALLPLVVGCSLEGSRPAEYPQVEKEAVAPAIAGGIAEGPTLEQDEATVAKEARLDAITRIALAKSPTVLEARARTKAALARVKTAGRLPDLEFKYELWAQPMRYAWDPTMTQMHMFGLRQSFPAGGMLDAQTRMAMEEANIALQTQRARELDVVADVRKAWSTYWSADREKVIHQEHGEITNKIFELAKAQLQVAKTSQADVLRFDLERSRVHTDIISLGQEKSTALARLNLLMGRKLDAPIGDPPEPKLPGVAPRIEELRAAILKRRPELAAAGAAVKKSEAAVAGAKSEAKVPMVMLGVDYMLMPMGPYNHNFGAMVQLSLPWLNPRHGDEIRAAEATVAADKTAAKALEDAILLQVQEALIRYRAARNTFDLIDSTLLPQARKTFDALLANYGAGGGDSLSVVDSLRTLLQIRIDRNRALAQVELAIADVERSIGGPIPSDKKDVIKETKP